MRRSLLALRITGDWTQPPTRYALPPAARRRV